MNAIRAVGRTVVESSVALARFPIDLASQLLPNGSTGPRQAVRIATDTAEARVLGALGAVLRDPDLRADADRRLIAAQQRKDALALRGEAVTKRTKADERVAEERESAEKQRVKAKAEATEARKATVQDAEKRKAQVAETAAETERQIAETAAREEEALANAAKEDRLAALDQRAEALDAEAEALTAADEAARLDDATAKAKAARKATG